MQLDLVKQLFGNKSKTMNEYQNNIPMQSWCEDDKPGTKLLMKGKAAVSDSELLSLLIAKDCKDFSSLDIARKILFSCNDNLGAVVQLTVSDLMKYHLSRAMAIRVQAAFEIGRRRNATSVAFKEKIRSSKDAFEIFKSCLGDLPYEEFWVLLLNRANKVIQKVRISEGGISGTVVDPKKIFKIALDNHASSIILGHNHPSSLLTPSEADAKITKKLVEAGKLLEIAVLDHLIIGDNGFYSFADEGSM
ncbi:MAG: DNA repair protein RadC [Bacteroidota bacterium]